MKLDAFQICEKFAELKIPSDLSFSISDIESIVRLASQLPDGAEIVEIGMWYGRSALTWLLATEGSHITCIDELPNQDAVRGFAEKLGVADRISFIRSDVKDVYWDKMVDVVWIDGDHSVEGCTFDLTKFDKYAKLLTCGHDYTHPELPEVKVAVDKYFEGKPNKIHLDRWTFSYWKTKADEEKLPTPEITLVSLFIGRKYCLEQYFESLYDLDYPKKQINLIWHDTSHDPEFEKRLDDWVEKYKDEYKSLELLKCEDPHFHFGGQNVEAINAITEAYNHCRLHFKGDYFFALEDDIWAPPHTLRRLVWMIKSDNQIKGVSTKNIYRPSTKVHPGKAIAWNLGMSEIFPGEKVQEFSPVMMTHPGDKTEGVEYIGSAHLGCTLLDGDWVRQNQFTASAANRAIVGPDIAIGYLMQRQKFKFAIDWSLKTRHYDLDGSYV